jgi:hypothetical protein
MRERIAEAGEFGTTWGRTSLSPIRATSSHQGRPEPFKSATVAANAVDQRDLRQCDVPVQAWFTAVNVIPRCR